MMTLRIIFMGTSSLAAAVLEHLMAAPFATVIAAVSQPDKPKGRELKLHPTPVKEVALKHGLPVLQPAKARDAQFIEHLRGLGPDLIAVAAYGQILPQSLLDIPRLGCLNVHTSLLPKYRGAAPIQWAILNGDDETGVSIMKMDAGLDTGAVVSTERTPISPDETAQSLHDRLAEIGGELLVRTIPEYAEGRLAPQPQPADGATYARKISKEDGKLDWSSPALILHNKVRGLIPWPGTFCKWEGPGGPVVLKIWQTQLEEGLHGQPGTILRADKTGIVVAAGTGAVRIMELQREGGKRLSVQQFLAGCAIRPGEKLA